MDNLHKYGLKKEYLSYSAISLWHTNKNQFRDRYYLNKKAIDTKYTLFGKEVHAQLGLYPHIPLYNAQEHEIRLEIGGVPIRGFIDSFNASTLAFYEYKTGLIGKDGESRWTMQKVMEHKQLPFYSLLIREKYGSYNPNTVLILLETEIKKNVLKKGNVDIILSEGLCLTGRSEMFCRKIDEKELDEIKNWIVTSAEEISDDYTTWQTSQH